MLRPGKAPTSAFSTASATTSNPYSGFGNGGGSARASPTAIPSGGGGEYGTTYSYGTTPSYATSNRYTRPQFSSDSDLYKDKPRQTNKRYKTLLHYAHVPLAWASLGAVILFVLLGRYYNNATLNNAESMHPLAFGNNNNNQGREAPSSAGLGYSTPLEEELQHDIVLLERQIKALESERDTYRKRANQRVDEQASQHIDSLTARDFAWKEQVQVLQNATQRESKRSATELFGPGPHHVKITVVLPTDEAATPHHFILKMAPLDVMPHAVHFFLQQVVHGLWNNAWFYLNGPHVMQAGPQASEDEEELWHLEHEDDDERAVALRSFRAANLDSLAFPEYSEKFPHAKWTMGFTGRPGGPDFYLNKMDNRKAHGPGGQFQHELHEYGDPCFAKVVDGFDTLERMFQEPTYPDDHEWGWFYEDPIHIVSAKIMEDAPLKVEVAQEENLDQSQKPDKPLKKPKLENQVVP